MRGIKVAKRYAVSLLDLALEQKKQDAVAADMQLLMDTIDATHDLSVFLNSPVVAASKKTETLTSIFEGKVDALTMGFFKLLTKNKRESLLYEIAVQYQALYKEHKNILVAEVVSASKMDKNLEDTLKEKISAIHDGSIEMNNKVDESLIGGFILRIGDKQVDTSIARKLQDLKKVFSEN